MKPAQAQAQKEEREDGRTHAHMHDNDKEEMEQEGEQILGTIRQPLLLLLLLHFRSLSCCMDVRRVYVNTSKMRQLIQKSTDGSE